MDQLDRIARRLDTLTALVAVMIVFNLFALALLWQVVRALPQ